MRYGGAAEVGATSKWLSGAATDMGLVRTSNEDRYGISDAAQLVQDACQNP